MAKYTVIADVGKSIIDMLKANIVPEPVAKPENIGLCDPKDRGSFVVGIHPYDIIENREMTRKKPINLPDGYQQDPPSSYKIKYILSISSKVEITNRSAEEQRILGRILQLFKDNKIIDSKYMSEALSSSNESMSLEILPLELEEKVKIWSMFSEPYKLSIFFSVGDILIESNNIKVPSTRVESVEIDASYKK